MPSGCQCDECDHFVYDEEWDDYACEIDMDMDDRARLLSDHTAGCPFYQVRDEYRIVRKQN